MHNNHHHGENWAVAVLVSIPLALHSKPKPRQPSFACGGRYEYLNMDIKSLVRKAFSITVPYSIMVFSISAMFSTHVQTFDQDGNLSGTISGFNAIVELIDSSGVLAYLQFVAPSFGLFFLFILGALLIQGAVYERIKNS